MFICDCHCDTLTELYNKNASLYELYNKNASLYENEQHFDIKRQIALGGGLQFCAINARLPLAAACNSALFTYLPKFSAIRAACVIPCACLINTTRK